MSYTAGFEHEAFSLRRSRAKRQFPKVPFDVKQLCKGQLIERI